MHRSPSTRHPGAWRTTGLVTSVLLAAGLLAGCNRTAAPVARPTTTVTVAAAPGSLPTTTVTPETTTTVAALEPTIPTGTNGAGSGATGIDPATSAAIDRELDQLDRELDGIDQDVKQATDGLSQQEKDPTR